MRSQSSYAACSSSKCTWHTGDFSFESLFSNACFSEDTEHFLGHQKHSV